MSDFVNLLINNYRIDRYCIVIAYEYIILDILYLFKHSVKEKPLFVHIFVLFSGNIYGGLYHNGYSPSSLACRICAFRENAGSLCLSSARVQLRTHSLPFFARQIVKEIRHGA